MKRQLIYPMAFYVFYIWLLAILNLRTRFRSVQTGEVGHKYYKSFTQGAPSEYVVVVGRHYDNQFQLPMLFFITCLTFLVAGHIDHLVVFWAWTFVVTRLCHSFIHLRSNHVLQRLVAFAAGWLVLAIMWVQLCFSV